jgi:hypothetical protein
MVPDPDALNAALRAEADRLLDSGLRCVLSSFGEMIVVGSYALELMAWRDLDIEIVAARPSRAAFFDLGGRIADVLTPPRMHFRDETIARTPGLPDGFYWGIHFGDERCGAWKVDIWCVDTAQAEAMEAHMNRLRAKLSPDSRRTIIAIKSQVWSDPGYRRTFFSQDLYTAVLDHNVRDVDAFREFLRARR